MATLLAMPGLEAFQFGDRFEFSTSIFDRKLYSRSIFESPLSPFEVADSQADLAGILGKNGKILLEGLELDSNSPLTSAKSLKDRSNIIKLFQVLGTVGHAALSAGIASQLERILFPHNFGHGGIRV